MMCGWRTAISDFLVGPAYRARIKTSQAVRDEIFDGVRWEVEKRDRRRPLCRRIDPKESDLPVLRRCLQRYRDFINNELDESTRAQVLNTGYGDPIGFHRLWLEDYELHEANYFRYKAWLAQLKSDPDLVLRYILEQDPHHIWPARTPESRGVSSGG